jgi:hypothetical protein
MSNVVHFKLFLLTTFQLFKRNQRFVDIMNNMKLQIPLKGLGFFITSSYFCHTNQLYAKNNLNWKILMKK